MPTALVQKLPHGTQTTRQQPYNIIFKQTIPNTWQPPEKLLNSWFKHRSSQNSLTENYYFYQTYYLTNDFNILPKTGSLKNSIILLVTILTSQVTNYKAGEQPVRTFPLLS